VHSEENIGVEMDNLTIRKRVLDILELARNEILTPPIQLGQIELLDKSDELNVEITEGVLHAKLGSTLLRESNWHEILLWTLRHELAHIHYCPYDLRTAHQLEREAFSILKDWRLAHSALVLFTDLMVDLIYLPRISLELPLHIIHRFRKQPSGIDILLYAVHKRLLKDNIPDYNLDTSIYNYSRDILEVIFSGKTWLDKQRLIAAIILRLITTNPKIKKNLERQISSTISLVEDVKGNMSESLRRVYGRIRNPEEAKAFYENWIKPKTSDDLRKIESNLKKVSKRSFGRYRETVEELKRGEVGEEPLLPTSKSRPLKRVKKELLESAMWRSLWYRSRAVECLVEYLSSSKIMRIAWSEATYPIDWTTEDDIEDLDLDSTLEEGSPIPESNTVMWIKRKMSMGSIISSSSSPPVIIVLDSSKSMMNNFDCAAVAAFILLASARRAGGRTAIVNFSTKYLVADWSADERVKDIILAIKMGEYTILPIHVIAELVSELNERVFVNIITDCGWQNIHEVLPRLTKISELGHKITIFHVYGWKYDRNIAILSKKGIDIIKIMDPTRELNKLALSIAGKIYRLGYYVYWLS